MLETAPITAEQAPRRRRQLWLLAYPRAVPIAIFLLVAAITAIAVLAIENTQANRRAATLAGATDTIAAGLLRTSYTTTSNLRAGAALLSTSQDIPRERFTRFVNELQLADTNSATEGIGWAPVIEGSEVQAYQEEVRQSGEPVFTINPSPRAQDAAVAPVTLVAPDSLRNRRALGFDMYSERVRSEAMQAAANRIQPVASAPVVLEQEKSGDAPGFIIYMPVFRGASAANDLAGFIYGAFTAENFLASALQPGAYSDYGVRLYDGSATPENLIAQQGTTDDSGKVARQQLVIANRPFILEVEAPGVNQLSDLSMATLLFGLSVAILLILLARLSARQAAEDIAYVRRVEEQDSIRNALSRELNHRVKNTLANVLSIMALTRRRSNGLDEFAKGLEGRIRALSATHDLLTGSEWGTTPIRSVLEAELAPYLPASDTAIEMSGPDVELAPNDALSLGMAIHELATNAAKYGALSQAGGKVLVSWRLEDNDLAVIDWRETGGPEVSELREPGFGTELIEKITAHELRHPVDLRFPPQGVTCTLRVPVRSRGDFRLRER